MGRDQFLFIFLAFFCYGVLNMAEGAQTHIIVLIFIKFAMFIVICGEIHQNIFIFKKMYLRPGSLCTLAGKCFGRSVGVHW